MLNFINKYRLVLGIIAVVILVIALVFLLNPKEESGTENLPDETTEQVDNSGASIGDEGASTVNCEITQNDIDGIKIGYDAKIKDIETKHAAEIESLKKQNASSTEALIKKYEAQLEGKVDKSQLTQCQTDLGICRSDLNMCVEDRDMYKDKWEGTGEYRIEQARENTEECRVKLNNYSQALRDWMTARANALRNGGFVPVRPLRPVCR